MRERPPQSHFIHFHAVFGKDLGNRFLALNSRVVVPLVWESLDPALACSHFLNQSLNLNSHYLCPFQLLEFNFYINGVLPK